MPTAAETWHRVLFRIDAGTYTQSTKMATNIYLNRRMRQTDPNEMERHTTNWWCVHSTPYVLIERERRAQEPNENNNEPKPNRSNNNNNNENEEK